MVRQAVISFLVVALITGSFILFSYKFNLINVVYAEEELVEQRRLRLWSAQTQNRDLIYSTYARIKSMRGEASGSWVYEWSKIGNYFSKLAKTHVNNKRPDEARDAYLKAVKFYGIARFPAKTLPGQVEAYNKHLQNYKLAGQYFNPPLRIIEIPYLNSHIEGYLHMPPDISKPPLILWNGGIDTWKGDSYNNIQPYIAAGFAVLTFDVLGTGENSSWVAKPDSNDLHAAVIDFMRDNPLIDGRYIAHVGFSFSGYYAARNALTEPRLFAVISACGPIHEGWSHIYKDSPWEIQEALAAALHLSMNDAQKMQETAEGFSLVKQGLLNGPDSIKIPTLIINGDLDTIAPVADLHLLADSGRQTDLWIMGGDVHCFGQYRSVVMPKMAQWLQKKLKAYKSVTDN